jgi:methylglutaconyl-CoA hydratase
MRALKEANLILTDKEFNELVKEHSLKRMSNEAFEGLNSFSEKRHPSWYPKIKDN